jgi:hypothetical protein
MCPHQNLELFRSPGFGSNQQNVALVYFLSLPAIFTPPTVVIYVSNVTQVSIVLTPLAACATHYHYFCSFSSHSVDYFYFVV